MENEILTFDEVVVFFKVSPRTLHNWINAGKITPLRNRASRLLRFNKKEVEEFFKKEGK